MARSGRSCRVVRMWIALNWHIGCRQGARFAKWRAAVKVGPGLPSEHALSVNAQQLAQYAAVCQARRNRGACRYWLMQGVINVLGSHCNLACAGR